MIRPWWRIPESRSIDDNPDISDYVGRGEVEIVHEWNGQEFGLTLRDSFRGGSRQHGSLRFGWSFPIAGNLRGYAELFKGRSEEHTSELQSLMRTPYDVFCLKKKTH